MKPFRIVVFAGVAALAPFGCKPAPQPLTERETKQAAALTSEASFAMRLREWPRAEKLLLDAIKITPDPVFYHNLGLTRVRMGNRAGAKEAYLAAIEGCDRQIAADKASAEPWIKKMHLLALLGRVDDARALVRKLEQQFPKDPAARAVVEGKKLDEFLASPAFKENAL